MWISVIPKVFNLASKEGETRGAIPTLLSEQQSEIQSFSGEQGEFCVGVCILTNGAQTSACRLHSEANTVV